MARFEPRPLISAEERRLRQKDRLKTIRLRMAIYRYLDERGITTPAEIGEALGMPAAEAASLLAQHQWREGDVAQLEVAAARPGVQVPAHDGCGNATAQEFADGMKVPEDRDHEAVHHP